ncbi:hypothetical protein MHYP_G00171670 [Metynnis hypsauchen]
MSTIETSIIRFSSTLRRDDSFTERVLLDYLLFLDIIFPSLSPKGICIVLKCRTQMLRKSERSVMYNTQKHTKMRLENLKQDNDEPSYWHPESYLAANGQDNDLITNISKTKEVILDFRGNTSPLHQIHINSTETEQVKFWG